MARRNPNPRRLEMHDLRHLADSERERITAEEERIRRARTLGEKVSRTMVGKTGYTIREGRRLDAVERDNDRKLNAEDAEKKIRTEAKVVGEFLEEIGLPTEVTIERTRLTDRRRSKVLTGGIYRKHRKELRPNELRGWILTSSFQTSRRDLAKPGPHQGFVLGEDGEIYPYTADGFKDGKVQSRYDTNDEVRGDHYPIVYPIQVRTGVYSEEQGVLDTIYKGRNFSRGVQDPGEAHLIHGNGVREALANLVAMAENLEERTT